jgi:hypothetical protein
MAPDDVLHNVQHVSESFARRLESPRLSLLLEGRHHLLREEF